MNLRDAARGRECMVRLPGCDGGGETTVLAHYRMSGLCGVGQKPIDLIGAWACHRCHEIIDRRAGVNDFDHDYIRLAHAEAVLRTLDALSKGGLL